MSSAEIQIAFEHLGHLYGVSCDDFEAHIWHQEGIASAFGTSSNRGSKLGGNLGTSISSVGFNFEPTNVTTLAYSKTTEELLSLVEGESYDITKKTMQDQILVDDVAIKKVHEASPTNTPRNVASVAKDITEQIVSKWEGYKKIIESKVVVHNDSTLRDYFQGTLEVKSQQPNISNQLSIPTLSKNTNDKKIDSLGQILPSLEPIIGTTMPPLEKISSKTTDEMPSLIKIKDNYPMSIPPLERISERNSDAMPALERISEKNTNSGMPSLEKISEKRLSSDMPTLVKINESRSTTMPPLEKISKKSSLSDMPTLIKIDDNRSNAMPPLEKISKKSTINDMPSLVEIDELATMPPLEKISNKSTKSNLPELISIEKTDNGPPPLVLASDVTNNLPSLVPIETLTKQTNVRSASSISVQLLKKYLKTHFTNVSEYPHLIMFAPSDKVLTRKRTKEQCLAMSKYAAFVETHLCEDNFPGKPPVRTGYKPCFIDTEVLFDRSGQIQKPTVRNNGVRHLETIEQEGISIRVFEHDNIFNFKKK